MTCTLNVNHSAIFYASGNVCPRQEKEHTQPGDVRDEYRVKESATSPASYHQLMPPNNTPLTDRRKKTMAYRASEHKVFNRG